jgi:hypothetical protein
MCLKLLFFVLIVLLWFTYKYVEDLNVRICYLISCFYILFMQRIPHQTMKFALNSRIDSIPLIHMDNGQTYQCVLLTEDVGSKRRYLVGGWFDFLRQYNLKAGDVLKFYLDYPDDQLYVDIVRRKSL